MGDKEAAKKLAAEAAVDTFVKDGMVVGIGSGSTVVYVVKRLQERVQKEKLNVRCIPTSFQSRQLIVEGGLVLTDLSINPEIDVAIDGADEADENLNLIKGGGGALTQEKIVAFNSKLFVVVADESKQSTALGTKWKKGVPVEVIPMAYVPLQKKIEKIGGKAILRMAEKKAGPVVTDNGNFLLDIDFGIVSNPKEKNEQLLHLPGVVETGFFIQLAHTAFFGQNDGSVISLDQNGNKNVLKK